MRVVTQFRYNYVKQLRPTFEPPSLQARSAPWQERGFAPGPSPALALHKTPHFRGPRPKSATPYQGRREKEPPSLASGTSSCQGVQLRCGSARHKTSAVPTSGPAHVFYRSSKVSLRLDSTWPLFRSNFAGINPSKMLRASRKQPSASAPACWRRGCRASGVGIKTFALATQPCCPSPPAPELPHQRCWAVLLFVG